ncbi:MAG: ImmA/IrrE family metallo-endopeptidase [Alphaproteobacteria bacterium]|nr:ImmA/IrrE family metallo-endopeptidase [Alphaproteobacteria bacterium]
MATDLSNWQNFLSGGNATSRSVAKKQTPQTMSVSEIWAKAKELKIKTDPLDIASVVEKIFGIKLIKKDLGKSASGFLEQIDNQWCIYINQYESEQRQRFTIAHELGHYVKHREKYANGRFQHDLIFFRDENTNPDEREANDFASNLLMPETIVNDCIKRGENTVKKLADKFNLSTPAVRYRAYKLGLISEY